MNDPLIASAEKNSEKKVLTTLLGIFFVSQLLFYNIGAFMPTFVEKNYPDITSFQVGCIFACYPFAYTLNCPFAGNFASKFGLKTSIIGGLNFMAASTVLFGMASYSSTQTTFIAISVLARIIQAMGDSVVCVVIPVMMSSLYTES